jgi:subtilisin family serine protease
MVRPRSTTVTSSLALFVALFAVSTENLQHTSNSQPRRDGSIPAVFINSWAVKIRGGLDDADAVARRYGFHNLGLVQGFDDVYKFRLGGREMQKVRSDSPYRSSIASDKLVEFAEQQFRRQVVTKSYVPPEDSILKEQWNLLNTGQYGDRYKGNDLRVVPAWLQGYTGCNVTVTVVDDGIDFRHPALWPNFAPMVSYDHHDNDSDPSTYDHEHGTSVSGIVGAAKNSTCAVGIAYECNLGSVRLLNGNRDMRTDVEEATALSHEQNIVDVYTNSWGPSDTGNIVMGPRTLTKLTLEKGISEGRNGKGSIFVWASGNGRDEDDCAADGYVSSIYTIAVGAIGVDSHYSFFDERCSGKMVVAYVTNPEKRSAIVGCYTFSI